ncbi:GAF domain-containing protein [Nostocoides sp. F2B08]|uniref:GAF domain-containing protein n=1 Tax=Nostocoides sp. F2B08 TaxID=2653936 RepID=UPI00186B1408|nr:GAF domain-containing protein [Tetrasphaera sp. F2B08]
METRPDLLPAVAAVRDLFGAAAASCALVADAGDRLTFVAASGAGADRILGVELPVGRGIAGWVAMTDQAIAVRDVASDTRFARDVAEATEYVPRSVLAVPVSSGQGDMLGVLEVLDPATDLGSGWPLAVLGTCASLVGLLLDRSQGTAERLRPAELAAGLADGDFRSTQHAAEVLSAVAEHLRGRRG